MSTASPTAQANFDALGEPARFLLRWLFMFGEDPMPGVYWTDVLECETFGLDEGTGLLAHDELVDSGWIVDSKDEDGDVCAVLVPGKAELVDEVLAEFKAKPFPSLEDIEVCVLAASLEDGGWLQDGGDLLDGWLVEGEELVKIADGLRDRQLLLEYEKGDAWKLTCSPWAWCLREEVRTRAEAAQPAMRKMLLDYLKATLELEEGCSLQRALEGIDRADFIPRESQSLAYRNIPVGILEAMTTSQPFVLAHILHALAPQKGDRVLLCGAKSGILATLAAHMVGAGGHVHCVESREDVVEYARSSIKKYPQLKGRIQVHHRSDVTIGDEEYGPWDAVIVNGGLAKIPRDILTQMSDTGRLLFFLHAPQQDSQVCYLVRKNEDVLDQENLSNFVFTPMYGRYGWDDPADLNNAYKRARLAREKGGPGQTIDHDLPYPLAKAYGVAVNVGDPVERHTRALKAFENLIKYFTLPLMASWRAAGRNEPTFARHLHTIADRPSLGQWLAAARDLSKPGDLGGTAASIRDALHAVQRHPRLLSCLAMIKQRVPSLKMAAKNPTLLDFLGAIIAYRNSSGEGHGAVRGRSDLEEPAQLLVDALGVLLTKTPWLTGHRLLYLDQTTRDRRGLHVRALDFQGASPPRVVPEAECESWFKDDKAALDRYVGRILIRDGEGGFLSLDPWIIWGRGTSGENEDLFFFRAKNGAGDPEYLTTHDPNGYPPSELRQAFEELLEEFPVECKEVDREGSLRMFELMLDNFLDDGVLDAKEMGMLCSTLLKFELFATQADAEQYVRRVAEDHNPGVVFED